MSVLPRSPIALALIAAVLVHAAEVGLALRLENAVLSSLPSGVLVRVLALAFFAALVPALVGGVLSLPFRSRPKTARVIAIVGAILFPAVEVLRHQDDLRGQVPNAYLIACAVVAVICIPLALMAPPSYDRDTLRAPSAISVCAALAIGIVFLSAFGLPKPGAVAIAEEDTPRHNTSDASKPTENLIVLMVDTLRADHLGCYGYARETSPRIDAFAAESARFENAATPKPKTSPAIASLFTGLWPETHGIHSTSTVLPDEHFTLAEVLEEAGFQTFAVAANVNISKRFGFDQGFQDFRRVRKSGGDSNNPKERAGKNASRVRDQLVDWLDHREDGRFFAYVHFIDPHSPYSPPKEFASRFRGDELDGQLGVTDVQVGVDDYDEVIHEAVYLPAIGRDLDGYVARYDAEISYTDKIIGEILDDLERRGLLESTTIVFTADHGESMTEHQTWFNHGEHPYEEQVHIPLIVHGPGVPSGTRSDQVSLVGLMPTLLDLVGVDSPSAIEGQSFASRVFERESSTQPTDTHTDRATYVTARHGKRKLIRGVRTNRWKYLTRGSGIDLAEALTPQRILLPGTRIPTLLSAWRNHDLTVELYDLNDDPTESENLAWRLPDERLRMETLAKRHEDRPPLDVPKPVRLKAKDLSTEAAEELRQMGYLGGH